MSSTIGSGYDSAGSIASQSSRERSKMSRFYAKIKDPKSLPVRSILETYYISDINKE